ncbi:GNAT family N-acetyltransferase [Anaerococcus sp. DFU013_CI05]|uniref:GNAT family N-acetyltransferase n=1 Tax=Anaerococcus sp. AH8042_DFU013_CI05 TaxID=3385202 RepID=UPI0025EC34BE|nr:GNAT family N-acetyltransferase [uncultured Anaerococcus sp.]
MKLKQVKTQEDKEYFEKLYQSSFPEDERIGENILYGFFEKNLIDILILIKDENKVGMAVIYLNKNIHLLSYLAIDPKYRGQGMGSEALKLFKVKYEDLIIEIESTRFKDADDFALRNRRKAFYIKNGFNVLEENINYFGIEMELMATTKDAGLDEYMDTYLNIFEEDYINENIKAIDI